MTQSLTRTHRFQEHSIKTWILEMNGIFFDFEYDFDIPPNPDFDEVELKEAKRKRFEFLADKVYNLCIAYFESKNLRFYLDKFEEKVKPFFADRKAIFASYTSLGSSKSALTHTFELFLNSFPEFASEGEWGLTGLDFLENILKGTAVILKSKGIMPTSEVQVYRAVKIHCQAAFPGAIFPTESFQKTARRYKPDILIPLLGCAVEYKYAQTEKKLITTIDEILVDVKGYENDNGYRNFYAVFYVKPGYITEERFEQIWREKRFPENWKGIFVLGS